MGKPLVRFCEGQEFNCDMDKILWHRRESRRKQRKQILPCSHGSLLSTRKSRIGGNPYLKSQSLNDLKAQLGAFFCSLKTNENTSITYLEFHLICHILI